MAELRRQLAALQAERASTVDALAPAHAAVAHLPELDRHFSSLEECHDPAVFTAASERYARLAESTGAGLNLAAEPTEAPDPIRTQIYRLQQQHRALRHEEEAKVRFLQACMPNERTKAQAAVDSIQQQIEETERALTDLGGAFPKGRSRPMAYGEPQAGSDKEGDNERACKTPRKNRARDRTEHAGRRPVLAPAGYLLPAHALAVRTLDTDELARRLCEGFGRLIWPAYSVEAVEVVWQPMREVNGHAHWDATKELYRTVAAPARGGRTWPMVLETLLHETGHAVLGHVPKPTRLPGFVNKATGQVDEARLTAAVTEVATPKTAADEAFLRQHQQREQDAHAWAAERVGYWLGIRKSPR